MHENKNINLENKAMTARVRGNWRPPVLSITFLLDPDVVEIGSGVGMFGQA